MKIITFFFAIILFVSRTFASGAHVGNNGVSYVGANARYIPSDLTEQHRIQALMEEQEAAKRSEEAARRWEQYKAQFVPDDPWREFQGKTNFIKTVGVEFYGKVKEVRTDGIVLDGRYGPIFEEPINGNDTRIIFVANLPYQVVDDQFISEQLHLMVFDAGTTKIEGKTVRRLDWGRPCEVPEEIVEQQNKAIIAAEAAKLKAEQEKAARIFKSRKILADQGESVYQYLVGKSYATGDGTDKNLTQANEYLTKAADQGNANATKLLAIIKETHGDFEPQLVSDKTPSADKK